MKDFTQLTPEELEKLDKNVLITIIRLLQLQLNTISPQLTFLTDQITLMNQRSVSRMFIISSLVNQSRNDIHSVERDTTSW